MPQRPPSAQTLVVGRARERADAVAPEIAADKAAELFLVGSREEGRVQLND